MLTNRRAVTLLTALSFSLFSCATTDSSGRPLSALDRSINQCIGSIVVGSILGAVIGAATSHKAGQGALIGAGAGSVMCAVFVAMNNAQDKERVRQSELAAARTAQNQTTTYTGNDGKQRKVETTSEPAIVPAAFKTSTPDGSPAITGPCRKTRTQITVQNAGTATLDPEVICRNAAGDYVKVPEGSQV